MGIREAIAAALRNDDHELAKSRWSDSLSTAEPKRESGGVRFGNRIVDTRTVTVAAPPGNAFAAMERIGGSTGWCFGNALWQLRGWFDLLAGGVGMRRGRRDARHLLAGDVVDYWRVESIELPRRLRLTAEMKLPGRAWLEFDVQPAKGGVTLRQTATFDPVGLSGLAYWYGLFALHELVFRGMIRNLGGVALASAVEAEHGTLPSPAIPPAPLR